MDYLNNYQFGSFISPVFRDKLLPALKDKKVLDVGCAQGEYLQYFSSSSLGLDIAPGNLVTADARKLRTAQADLNVLAPLEEKFDVVFISQVIEHVDSPINLLRFANSCMPTGGTVILSVPNERSLIHLKYPYYTQDGNHLYGFTINNMKELLLTAGFDEPEIYFDYHTSLTQRLKLEILLKTFDVLPVPIKSYFAWAYWFVARKSKDAVPGQRTAKAGATVFAQH